MKWCEAFIVLVFISIVLWVVAANVWEDQLTDALVKVLAE